MYASSLENTSLRARRELYGLLAELLSFPTRELGEAISHGNLARSLRGVASALPYHIDVGSAGFRGHIDPTDLEAEYIRLFDLPGGGKPCPLYTGVYAPARREAMEELLRFYRHFGVTLGNQGRDLPDAVPTVVEFQQYLVLREAAADSVSGHQARAAQSDLLNRHLRPWAAATRPRLKSRIPEPFYEAVIALADEMFTADAAYLETALETSPGDPIQYADHPVRV